MTSAFFFPSLIAHVLCVVPRYHGGWCGCKQHAHFAHTHEGLTDKAPGLLFQDFSGTYIALVRCFPLVHRRTRALRPPPACTTCAILARPTCMIFVVFPLQQPRAWSTLGALPRMRRARCTSATRAERRTSKAARFAHGGAARGGGISLSYCR